MIEEFGLVALRIGEVEYDLARIDKIGLNWG